MLWPNGLVFCCTGQIFVNPKDLEFKKKKKTQMFFKHINKFRKKKSAFRQCFKNEIYNNIPSKIEIFDITSCKELIKLKKKNHCIIII